MEPKIICNESGCQLIEKPALLIESDLAGMSYVDLLGIFQQQARYNEVAIPNPFKNMVNNFDGYLKTKYGEEKINQIGDLSNLRLITGQLKRFMKE